MMYSVRRAPCSAALKTTLVTKYLQVHRKLEHLLVAMGRWHRRQFFTGWWARVQACREAQAALHFRTTLLKKVSSDFGERREGSFRPSYEGCSRTRPFERWRSAWSEPRKSRRERKGTGGRCCCLLSIMPA